MIDGYERRKFYEVEYTVMAEGSHVEIVYLDDIGYDDFSVEAEDAARDEVHNNPDSAVCNVGEDYIIDSDTIKINYIHEEKEGYDCVICKSEMAGYGNNADLHDDPPTYKSGDRCCNSCNTNVVIPARIKAWLP